MDLIIRHSWLKDHLDTNAKPRQIARSMSLCGPTFDRVRKIGSDWEYEIEITTNRVDTMSVRGIAREAIVILPEFGFKAQLKPLKLSRPNAPSKSVPLIIKMDPKLTHRVMAIVLEVDRIGKSPKWVKERLESSGIRSLNAAVDITNYVMTEVGHPTHVFDYDLVKPRLTLRESKRGEKIVSLEGKTYILPGGDIVIENEDGEIIDLPGIIGTKNSVVRDSTKRILFFLETNDARRIRKTSMTLGIRTIAATLNEKGVDAELAEVALMRGVELFKSLVSARVISKVHDIYSKKYKGKTVKVSHEFIEMRLGVPLKSTRVSKILTNLGFKVKLVKGTYTVVVPSSRSTDVSIPEDILEEVARIYGYHNLPSHIMTGDIPDPLLEAPFDREIKIKRILKGYGANEIMTYSMVAKDMAGPNSLKLKNPLGNDSAYMRKSLKSSLVYAAKTNSREKDPYHIYEMANVYLPEKGRLPEEVLVLAGILANTNYREAKGVIESLLDEMNVDYSFEQKDGKGFQKNHRLSVNSRVGNMGQIGTLENGFFYYEFDVEAIIKAGTDIKSYSAIPQYPAQIEDITLILPEKTRVGDIIDTIRNSNVLISDTQLVDIYMGKETAYTIRVWYQAEDRTLKNSEVKIVRKKILSLLAKKYGAKIKK